jgi:membrane fusion protein, type I secretion system
MAKPPQTRPPVRLRRFPSRRGVVASSAARAARKGARCEPARGARRRDWRSVVQFGRSYPARRTTLLIFGVGGWAATSQLAGAVIAPGTIVVESNIKKVQHPTGGVVGEILVKGGSEVDEGQIVLRLDDTVTRSTLGVVRSQLDELMAREPRLLAERDDASAILFPGQLTSRGNDTSATMAVAGEQKLFESRKTSRTGQRAQLRERIAQLNEGIRGVIAQLAAKESELELIGKELVGVTELYRKNLVSISRYTQLQRDQTRLQGERGQLIADVARARGKISEAELQIIQVDQDFRTKVLKDLREAQGKIAELKERLTAAEDQLKRVDLRARKRASSTSSLSTPLVA